MSSTERRRTPRTASRLSMVLSDQTREMATRTENISASGAYCSLPHFLPLMTKLEVRLELPGSPKPKPIRCQGVVVRVHPPAATAQRTSYDVAIFFNDLAERDRAVIAGYVQQHLPVPNA